MSEYEDVTKLVYMEKLLAEQQGEPVRLFQSAGQDANRTLRVFPLHPAIIGRDPEAEIPVDESGVSRRHARVEHNHGTPWLIDLESTNGTFVNGKRVEKCKLRDGDWIQIASAVFEVSVGRDAAWEDADRRADTEAVRQAESMLEQFRSRPEETAQVGAERLVLAGSIDKLNLSSLLQILESNATNGSLIIQSNGVAGRIYIEEGLPSHAELGSARGKKALFRLLALTDGRFELVPARLRTYRPTIQGPLESIIIDAAREYDEFIEYRKALPSDDATLEYTTKRTFVLDKLSPELLEVLAAIGRHQTVGAVIDECPLPDLYVCRVLLMLLNKKIVIERQEPDA